MIEVDVEDDRDLRPQRRDRSIRLVALHDEPAVAGTGVAAELRDLAADRERGIAPEPVEHERDHPARRRLAVRACDDDRVAQRDELRKELCARLPWYAAGVRGRDDGFPAVRYERVGLDDDLVRTQRLEVGRLDAVPASDLGSPR